MSPGREAAAALCLWDGSSSEDFVSLVREAWGTSWTSFFLSLCSSWDSCSENAWLHALQEEKGILLTDSGAVTDFFRCLLSQAVATVTPVWGEQDSLFLSVTGRESSQACETLRLLLLNCVSVCFGCVGVHYVSGGQRSAVDICPWVPSTFCLKHHLSLA